VTRLASPATLAMTPRDIQSTRSASRSFVHICIYFVLRHSRLSGKQEQGIEDGINALRKKPGRLRVVNLVEHVAARCRPLRVP